MIDNKVFGDTGMLGEPVYPYQSPSLGPLALALAKASAGFATVTRDKKVTIQQKSGGSYSFQYAPLESILAAVREPLAENGLAIVQMIDGHDLVSMLLHESGASLTCRAPLPSVDDIKGLGSAVTYLRRYAIQAMLGIAAEDDDDGSAATGDRVVSSDVEHGADGSLIGTVQVGDKMTSDFSLRQDAEQGPAIGFRLRGEKGGILVRAFGPLAVQLDAHRDAVVGKRVTVWGRIEPVTVPARGKAAKYTYQALTADRVSVPDVGVLPTDTADEPAAAPEGSTELTEAENAAIWDEVERIGA